MIKRKISRNKKGEDMLVDFWAILLFAVVLLLFLIIFILTKGDAKTNELTTGFSLNDLDYMLDSYIKAPSLTDDTKTNGEMIVEDYLNNDFARTENSFKKFFSGINTTDNNPIGKFSIIVSKSKVLAFASEFDVETEDYASSKLYKGKVIITRFVKTTLPNRDGEDIEVVLTMEYVLMTETPFK